MRLLDSSSLQLKDFPADQIPPYAILSHTWGDYEVSFADMEQGRAECKAGYEKIRCSCQQATTQDFGYIWVDTCCIDKSSSAELSEAINSMYSWYKKAKICYAYLADVTATMGIDEVKVGFANSRWFKRGWTLQELIGPSVIKFFSREWIEIGTKDSLCKEIAGITGISVGILTAKTSLESASIAKRMSWASTRATTRIEDVAYCLMGLFDVNMPLLYGEGEKAFIRLQEEIIKHSEDQSLFAWTDPNASADHSGGLLASSPAQFASSGDIVPYSEWGTSAPFSISNKGLRIDLHLSRDESGHYLAALHCPAPPNYDAFLGIYLKRVFIGDHQYARTKVHTLCSIKVRGTIQTMHIRSSGSSLQPPNVFSLHALQLRNGPAESDGYKLIHAASFLENVPFPIPTPRRWPKTAKTPYTFRIDFRSKGLAGALLLERSDRERLVILLGSTRDSGFGFDAASRSDLENLDRLQESFHPRPPGSFVILRNHRVRVDLDSQLHDGTMYHMVDISVRAIHHTSNPIDMAREVIPVVKSQARPPDETVNHGSRKHKLPFNFLGTQGHSRSPRD